MNAKHIVATAIAALALAAGSAAAEPQMLKVRNVTVNYADLDLATPTGTAMLYARLKAAANRACKSGGQLGLDYPRLERECRAAALERAIEDVGQPGLAALHAGSDARSG